ncbi:hypothetical protein L0664_04465 [Octadecabacter sp. G9-8]|uniref:Uncharacterized protein n=1 Tax=Octadecabacter dasysiphoniae TaxID=2909341 RepID=A0ABS9CSW3_9RHOB|nr:hypothetical protein [Octadecabacter dasysiphoniae]MCF2870312.1 hypothetical protein [Octadecabacter dasysiphoniae]
MTTAQKERLRAAQIIAALGNQEGLHPNYSKARCEAYFEAQGWQMPGDFAAYVTGGKQSDANFPAPQVIELPF